eukprot:TRINITY_DN9119_c0_g1_i1.p1 TRINITY_DN9119_c0_g1~~TRINITY_DN9119_c0_g1_i1.p1  ORF type:complete len:206 (+),score=40.73 TRINITY_DN9119_c0_g1_i1:195-812(+)
MSVDAIDNGINAYPPDVKPKYDNKTGLGDRVHHLNPSWNDVNQNENEQFQKAQIIVNEELIQQVSSIIFNWYPGRPFVSEAFGQRLSYSKTGEILVLKSALAWKDHLYSVEKEQKLEGIIKFVLFPDKTEGWRVQGVNIENSFSLRLGLKEEWRGVQDIDKLKQISQINDIVFVHKSGFIGGAKSFENALKMAELSLQSQSKQSK